ncbi:MAG: DUF3473 domain-containing protein [Gammaproteobacteria bacterium]
MTQPVVNALTIDVEDYFQVSAFEGHITRSSWNTLPCRVERNTDRILQMLDDAAARATFFTLGWVAERYPGLVRRIVDGGHELASHGYEHLRVHTQTPEQFRCDADRTKKLLEDIGCCPVRGYRAASYSIGANNLWALDTLKEVGYEYSSSIYPIRHDLYGMPEAPRFAFRHRSDGILEIPITTVEFMSRTLPSGGGGYFRLFPYALSRWLIQRVNGRERQSAIFYFHPWELDPEQPRQKGLPLRTRVRHYLNLGRMEGRLQRLLRDFSWDRVDCIFIPEEAEV